MPLQQNKKKPYYPNCDKKENLWRASLAEKYPQQLGNLFQFRQDESSQDPQPSLFCSKWIYATNIEKRREKKNLDTGKWILKFQPDGGADIAWSIIRAAIVCGRLGFEAKIGCNQVPDWMETEPGDYRDGGKCICVYTVNTVDPTERGESGTTRPHLVPSAENAGKAFPNPETDEFKILVQLRLLGFRQKIWYKMDRLTNANEYGKNCPSDYRWDLQFDAGVGYPEKPKDWFNDRAEVAKVVAELTSLAVEWSRFHKPIFPQQIPIITHSANNSRTVPHTLTQQQKLSGSIHARSNSSEEEEKRDYRSNIRSNNVDQSNQKKKTGIHTLNVDDDDDDDDDDENYLQQQRQEQHFTRFVGEGRSLSGNNNNSRNNNNNGSSAAEQTKAATLARYSKPV